MFKILDANFVVITAEQERASQLLLCCKSTDIVPSQQHEKYLTCEISGKIPLKSQNHGKGAEIDGEIPTNYLKNMQMGDIFQDSRKSSPYFERK
ncbi:hypothetical protein [Cytobacillus gottheilii]|uniref:hypothetical protein n=1 Tax=Cytobacillus gottheilii TaxID=859144 RepID=UPI003463C65E